VELDPELLTVNDTYISVLYILYFSFIHIFTPLILYIHIGCKYYYKILIITIGLRPVGARGLLVYICTRQAYQNARSDHQIQDPI